MASLGHCLHGLLSSIRCIAQHEDALCELLHELRHQSAPFTSITTELLALLDDLPSHDYLDDIEAVRDILGQSRTAARRKSRKAPAAKQRAQAKSMKTSRTAAMVRTGSRTVTSRTATSPMTASRKTSSNTRRKPSR
jgi:hypothetical protein